MKNMKRQRRRMATVKKIRQRERLFHNKCGGPTYWSHWDQDLCTRWDKSAYFQMKSQFPFSGDFRREKKEYNRFGRDKKKMVGDEGFDGAEPDCKPCFYCGKIQEIKVGEVCETCVAFLEDLYCDSSDYERYTNG